MKWMEKSLYEFSETAIAFYGELFYAIGEGFRSLWAMFLERRGKVLAKSQADSDTK